MGNSHPITLVSDSVASIPSLGKLSDEVAGVLIYA